MYTALQNYYQEEIPPLDIIDYEQWQCHECQLEFFHPLLPGSDRFYKWLSHQPDYYPRNRWEWHVVLNSIPQKAAARVLEVGCGNGDFLRTARRSGITQLMGIDTSGTAVDVCSARGLPAFCGTLEAFRHTAGTWEGSCDVVASFHCLEHVPDPLQLVLDMKAMLKPGGVLFLSTPYSPMSFEAMWYDPLNHPPHHLTRWNASSYHMLAKQTAMHIEFINPGNASAWQRSLQAFYIGMSGRYSAISKKRLLQYILQQPKLFWQQWQLQRRRELVAGMPAPDTILVKMNSL